MSYHALVESIVALHQESSGQAALAVNRWLILRNWVIGAHLVEFEQNGESRTLAANSRHFVAFPFVFATHGATLPRSRR